ncbi:hypothetical protein HDG70_001474 [Carboxydothermus ferrireducens DSM 11255]|uniref:Uncharacterized protein n=1 Tax=Carboxydothermus ferrireducens DSM 11255 TaxID=1119529 RepID=A0ABX2R9Z9_9THEO|nr:hypothetical protein [Carboxydothermus ferrireducens DSM 11255]
MKTHDLIALNNRKSYYSVLSMEVYERKLFESEIYFKLKEAELEEKTTNKRFSHDEVFSDLRFRTC